MASVTPEEVSSTAGIAEASNLAESVKPSDESHPISTDDKTVQVTTTQPIPVTKPKTKKAVKKTTAPKTTATESTGTEAAATSTATTTKKSAIAKAGTKKTAKPPGDTTETVTEDGAAPKKVASKGTKTVKKAATAESATTKQGPTSESVALKPAAAKPKKAGTTAKKSEVPTTESKAANTTGPQQSQRSSNHARSVFASWFARGTTIAASRMLGDDNNDHDHDDGDDHDDDGDGDDNDDDNDHDDDNDNEDDHQDRDQGNDNDNQHEHEHSGQHTGNANSQSFSHDTAKAAGDVISTGQSARPVHRNVQNTSTQLAGKVPATKSAPEAKARVTQVSAVELDEKKPVDEKQPDAPTFRPFLGVGLFEVIVKTLNILFPLFFIALGALHIIQIGQAQYATFPTTVSEIRTVAITIWPIMFAAIATQSLKAYGTFQAERGIKLMTLEQLLHSTSFSSAIKQPMLLRRLDWMSVVLFILWGLSPLASQALQRMSYTTKGTAMEPMEYNYTRPYFESNKAAQVAGNVRLTSMFGGALMSSAKVVASPQDSYDNPKLPRISAYVGSPDAQGWYNVNNTANDTLWASLLGIPFTVNDSLDEDAQQSLLNFTVETAYFDLDCSTFEHIPAAQFNLSNYYPSPSDGWFLNAIGDPTSQLTLPGYYNNGSLIFAFGNRSAVVDGQSVNAFYDVSSCNFNLVTVSAEIDCMVSQVSSSCAVSRIRQSHNDTLAQQFGLPLPDFPALLVRQLAGYVNGSGSLPEFYFSDPDNVVAAQGGNIASLDPKEFSTRAGVLVNTFFQASLAGAYIVGPDSSTVSQTYIAQGTVTNISPVWTVSIAWLVIYFFSVATILLFAIADIIWEAWTVSPDFLGFASSVVRNNQHLRKEIAGKKLSGHEKARAMSDLRVLLQDVSPDKQTGKIALAPANSGSSKLKRDRQYQ